MKRITKIIISSLIIILTLSTIVFGYLWYKATRQTDSDSNPSQSVNAKKFKQEYPTVANNNRFVYKNVQQIIDQLESGTGLIYLGFPECPWCQIYVDFIDEVARQEDLKEISYYNIRQIRKDNTPEYQRIIELLKDHGLERDENEQLRIFVPEVIAIRDGQIVGRDNTGSRNSIKTHGQPSEWWNKDRQTQVKTKLKNMIRELQTCGQTCN